MKVDFFRNSTADGNDGVAPVLASSSASLYTAGLRAGAPCPSSPAASFERSLVAFFCALAAIIAFGSVQGETILPQAKPTPDPWKLSLGASKPRPKNARTTIDNDDGASFDDAKNTLEFKGHVVVCDPQFTLFCDKLNVVMNPNRQGLQKITASGSVVIKQDNTNEQGDITTTIARAGQALYEPGTGNMTLTDWPQVQQGVNCQVATEQGTIMILNSKGTSRTIGQSRIMVVDPNKTK